MSDRSLYQSKAEQLVLERGLVVAESGGAVFLGGGEGPLEFRAPVDGS